MPDDVAVIRTAKTQGRIVVPLTEPIDYVVMLLVAAGVGAIGGLGAELLLKRADSTGTIEIPHRLKGTKLFALGLPASLIIGAIASVAVLYFFLPVTEVITSGTGTTASTVTREYSLVKLVPLALIVGSAGPAFLASAQSRLLSALNAQKVDAIADSATNQFAQIEESVKAATPGAVRKAVAAAIPEASAKEVQALADKTTAALDTALKPQVGVAQDQIKAMAASETSPAGDPPPAEKS